jgi:hypothetical protein
MKSINFLKKINYAQGIDDNERTVVACANKDRFWSLSTAIQELLKATFEL